MTQFCGTIHSHTLEYTYSLRTEWNCIQSHKISFGKTEVDFADFRLTENGIKPTNSMIKAIANFPTPTDITAICSWFGHVNQVAYTFAQADVMALFRKLL